VGFISEPVNLLITNIKLELSSQLMEEVLVMKDKDIITGSLMKPTPTSNIMEVKDSISVVMTTFGYLLMVN
jgi:hypothetical protein